MKWCIIKQKLKNIGKPKVYTVGVANYCCSGRWHLFYDLDKIIPISSKEVEVLAFTKHGIQLINKNCLNLNEVYNMFLKLKKTYKSDYYWSIPLWLRVDAKYNESGIISPAPTYLNPANLEWILKHFPIKKLYQSWD